MFAPITTSTSNVRKRIEHNWTVIPKIKLKMIWVIRNKTPWIRWKKKRIYDTQQIEELGEESVEAHHWSYISKGNRGTLHTSRLHQYISLRYHTIYTTQDYIPIYFHHTTPQRHRAQHPNKNIYSITPTLRQPHNVHLQDNATYHTKQTPQHCIAPHHDIFKL